MKPFPLVLVVGLAVFSGCSADRSTSTAEAVLSEAVAPQLEFNLEWLAGRAIHEPRLLIDADGSLLLVWREKSEEGSDIFAARSAEGASFGAAVRVNDEVATVESYPHDEMRPAVAVGSNGRVAVAWSDSRGQVRAAISADGATTFAPSTRLEQVEEPAYRGFPAIAFDGDGTLHAVWIDSRYAEGRAEEPADLYYATIVDGQVTESNLTAEQEPTVCGCCRTYIDVTPQGERRILFRNATADGYRDIFTASGFANEPLTSPRLVGQPLWKLQGCPMSGPIAAGDQVLWPDASSGRKLLMTASFGSEPATTLFSEDQLGDWKPRVPPRLVSSLQANAPLLLLPGQPSSRLISQRQPGSSWTIEAEDLPVWATDAVYRSGALLLVGAIDGEIRFETRSFEL